MHVLIAALHRPTHPAGICRYAINLARCLAETAAISQITLVMGSWQKHYFEQLLVDSSSKIDLIGVEIKNTSFSRNCWFLFGLPKLVKQYCPDLVHLSFPLPFIRGFFSCPVVSTIHDLYPYQFPENFGSRQVIFNQLFLNQCVHESDALTCVSHTTLESLKHYFPSVSNERKKAAVIYNYVDFDTVQAQPIADSQSLLQIPFILCVGQHRKNKNLDLLIKAYHTLIQESRIAAGTQLVIVGSPGPETGTLTQLIQECALEKSVLMLSSLPDEQLCWLYQNAGLFVIPSSLEGFCIPLVEALYFSCKSVCSNIPIFQEIGSTHCTYFDLDDEQALKNLTQAMLQALEQPRRDIARDSRFSKATIAQQSLSFYDKVL